jgi:hypothetical protein
VLQAGHDHAPADRGAAHRDLEDAGRAGRGVDKEIRTALAGGVEHGAEVQGVERYARAALQIPHDQPDPFSAAGDLNANRRELVRDHRAL